jgi:hypothetical protein
MTAIPNRGSLVTVLFIAAMYITPAGAHALDESKAASPYPDIGPRAARFDPTEPPGQGQETPPTVEHLATCEAYLADKKTARAATRPINACPRNCRAS